jgi:uncharacterized membrane protein
MGRIWAVMLGMVIAAFVVGALFYPILPEKLASHWNAQGKVDGYMGKFWGVFLMPVISVLLFLLFLAIPRIDPLKENIAKFRKCFDFFVAFVIAFLLYLYLLTLYWNLGARFDLIQALVPAFAALFYVAGVLIASARRNWFVGIRTPWTLSSETVWKKTHSLGGKLFKLSGIIALFGIPFPSLALFFVLAPVILAAVYSIVYSYFEYARETKRKKR